VHRQPAYEDLGGGHLSTSERLSTEILSLPLYPELLDAEVEAVAAAVARLA
jgi:dTDP-4-amino-4,6-dideoxygalactose transaminase